MNVTLAKALKIKSRLTGLIKEKREVITEQNSVNTGFNRCANIEKEFSDLIILHQLVATIKHKLMLANAGILDLITNIGEQKALLKTLGEIPTDSGMCVDRGRYSMDKTPIEKNAVISYGRLDDLKKATQKRIDEYQDSIDEYNHTVTVDLPDEVKEFI